MSHRGVVRVSQRKSLFCFKTLPDPSWRAGQEPTRPASGTAPSSRLFLFGPQCPRAGPARSPALGGQGKRGLFGRSWQTPGARTGVSTLGSVSALAEGSCPKLHLRYSKNRNTLTHLMNLRLKTSIKIHFDPQSGSNLNLVDAL